jgi:hypothetical protein
MVVDRWEVIERTWIWVMVEDFVVELER